MNPDTTAKLIQSLVLPGSNIASYDSIPRLVQDGRRIILTLLDEWYIGNRVERMIVDGFPLPGGRYPHESIVTYVQRVLDTLAVLHAQWRRESGLC